MVPWSSSSGRWPVNNWGGLGRWAFREVADPWDAGNLIRAKFLQTAGVRPG